MKTLTAVLAGFCIVVLVFVITSCGSTKTMALNSVQLTSQLKPGMSYSEVESILGQPRSTQVVNDQLIARWNLQEMWRGYIPYDMVFRAEDQTLVSWGENTKAFEQQQQQLKVVADELEKQQPATGGTVSGGNVLAPSPAFENDAALMNYFEGMYYSFSAVGGGNTGGTERKMSLCPDGKFRINSESGYSGGGWGTASQGGDRGTWRIAGRADCR